MLQHYILLTGFVALALFIFIGISSDIVHGEGDETISELNETTASYLVNTKTLEIGNASYQIRYQISGDNQLKTIWVQRDNITLAAEISAVSDGELTIELPRDVIDSKRQSNADDVYAIFIDGQFTPYDEIMNNTQARVLRIEFGNGSEQIEITGTHIVPEFGPLAALVLAISLASVVVVTRIKNVKGFNDLFRSK
ncbi:MAG: PEFG-CTERM sorting domain-containing protein [Nitrososphaeraceae archaeon]|jgi:predicted secreted protein with PEFG-CTERM motif